MLAVAANALEEVETAPPILSDLMEARPALLAGVAHDADEEESSCRFVREVERLASGARKEPDDLGGPPWRAVFLLGEIEQTQSSCLHRGLLMACCRP